jgi:hypothetical protein
MTREPNGWRFAYEGAGLQRAPSYAHPHQTECAHCAMVRAVSLVG